MLSNTVLGSKKHQPSAEVFSLISKVPWDDVMLKTFKNTHSKAFH